MHDESHTSAKSFQLRMFEVPTDQMLKSHYLGGKLLQKLILNINQLENYKCIY